MNAIVELSSDCIGKWTPSQEQCEKWLNNGLLHAGENRSCRVSVSYVEKSTSQSLNQQFRGKSNATNVLSFLAEFPPLLKDQLECFPLGDIVICPSIVEQEALQQGKELRVHWAHLLIHGLFHLLGYQHDSDIDAEKMEGLEIKTLESLGFPNPYLIV